MNKSYIGINIKKVREKSKISQKELADFLKIDQSLISRIEKNERNITVDLLDRISALFGIPSDSFLEENFDISPLNFAFRANDGNSKDLEAISYINKIALNLQFMEELSREE